MTAPPWADAWSIPGRLQRDLAGESNFRGRAPAATAELVRALTAARRRFGITRLGSLTRLDRAGVCVAQVVRPLSLSNAVSQGKGLDLTEAAASALMEALETWAAERIAAERIRTARACDLPAEIRDLYAGCLVHSFDAGWDRLPLAWIDGYDLIGARVLPVPTALVDTVYTYPSPHPAAFPRATTGLAAGPSLLAALLHAALEGLERSSAAAALRRPHSYPERRVDPASVGGGRAADILARLGASGLLAGIWRVASAHGLPVYRCHVVEGEKHREIAPLPGEGYGCDFTHDRALAKALAEAAQARVTALAGAREDITRLAYPERYDRERLAAWRAALSSRDGCAPLPAEQADPPTGEAALGLVLGALKQAGARAAIAVPLFSDGALPLEVVRLVAPPLRIARN
jgi:ribosomal protein S12 methylthiotransferase accessory factor